MIWSSRRLPSAMSMLREVYHRVKNNLQQIDGLIAIEKATLNDPDPEVQRWKPR